jgi:hypothetical protein
MAEYKVTNKTVTPSGTVYTIATADGRVAGQLKYDSVRHITIFSGPAGEKHWSSTSGIRRLWEEAVGVYEAREAMGWNLKEP